jgi:hypothetical protein
MYISFARYVSSVPGLTYRGYDGLKEIHDKNNTNPDESLIIPEAQYDRSIYENFLISMTEFKEKPNGIVSYLARTNNVDVTYTITMFSSMEDFLSIAQTSWFEDYAIKRADYLSLTGIQTYTKNVDQLPKLVTIETTFEELDEFWNQCEIIIA